jgi:hypothetical protein
MTIMDLRELPNLDETPDTAYTVGPDDHPSDSRNPAPEERCGPDCACAAEVDDDDGQQT